MLVVSGMSDRLPLSDVGDYARRVEELGFDVLHVPETVHDSMSVAMLALMATTRLRVQTSLTLAFPRSPMILALQAWDLSRESSGRFDLGLATQIRPNITGRFGVTWTDPIERMHDYVTSVRAIWRSFATGEPLSVATANYSFDRLQPFFNPGPLSQAPPGILLGGVNDRALELAGRSADVYVTHPTNSHPRFITDVVRPALDRGAAPRPTPAIVATTPFITGFDATEVAASREGQRAVLGFLYSTPAYRRQLEVFGLGDIGTRLRSMVAGAQWAGLGDIMTDEVLDLLVPQCTFAELAETAASWFEGLVDGLLLQPPIDWQDDNQFAEVIAEMKAIRPRSLP